MSVKDGVDSDFVDGTVTPFAMEVDAIFNEVDKEIPKEPRGGTALDGPNTAVRGPERGRLNRLHAEYVASPTENNLSALLAEVEIYARRVTVGRGRSYLHQSVTVQYPATEISSEAMTKVWRKLPEFKGDCKFATWVFRIAQNTRKDKSREDANRRESDWSEWKDYDDQDARTNNGVGKCSHSEPSDPNSGEGRCDSYNEQLPSGEPPRSATPRLAQLDRLIDELSDGDRDIMHYFLSGYSPREIGDVYNRDAKWVSNSLARIKNQLKLAAEAKSPGSGVLVMKGNKTPPVLSRLDDIHRSAA